MEAIGNDLWQGRGVERVRVVAVAGLVAPDGDAVADRGQVRGPEEEDQVGPDGVGEGEAGAVVAEHLGGADSAGQEPPGEAQSP